MMVALSQLKKMRTQLSFQKHMERSSGYMCSLKLSSHYLFKIKSVNKKKILTICGIIFFTSYMITEGIPELFFTYSLHSK